MKFPDFLIWLFIVYVMSEQTFVSENVYRSIIRNSPIIHIIHKWTQMSIN